MIRAKEIQWETCEDGFVSTNFGDFRCIVFRRGNNRWSACIKKAGIGIPLYGRKATELTADSAKSWCQSQLNSFIQQVAEVTND